MTKVSPASTLSTTHGSSYWQDCDTALRECLTFTLRQIDRLPVQLVEMKFNPEFSQVRSKIAAGNALKF